MARKTNSSPTVVYLLLLVVLVVFAIKWYNQRKPQTADTHPHDTITAAEHVNALEIPQALPGEKIIRHQAFTLSYNAHYKLSSWAAYLQTAEHTANANEKRTDRFQADPQITTLSAGEKDYRNNDFDRGHLVPAEDMAWSKPTLEESFYYTNIAPQRSAFNRGVWRRLEELVRFWSQQYDSIYIVTGPVLSASLPTMGKNRIAVPQQFYKVILQYNQKGAKGIGFLLANEASAASLKTFAVSIDSVEKVTGINFFPKLPDSIEEKIESDPRLDQWKWRREK